MVKLLKELRLEGCVGEAFQKWKAVRASQDEGWVVVRNSACLE